MHDHLGQLRQLELLAEGLELLMAALEVELRAAAEQEPKAVVPLAEGLELSVVD